MPNPSLKVSDLFQYGTEVHFDKGDVIVQSLAQGDMDLYILASGVCSLSSISSDGQETVYRYYQHHNMLNFRPLMTNMHLHSYGKKSFSVIAKTPCLAYHINARQFEELLTFPSVISLMFEMLARNNLYLLEHFHSSKNEPALVQLCRFLLDQATENEQGELVLDTFFTYQEMANYLGMHAVTVARMIKSLKCHQMIDKDGHQIHIIDPDKMAKLIVSEEKIDY